jgi:hypothetical protein
VVAENEQREAAPSGKRTVVVGLMADEGVPAKTAAALADDLPRLLGERLSDRVVWQVQALTGPISLDENGEIPMGELAAEQRANGYDVLVLLTDLPRRAGTEPIVSDFSVHQGVALLSLPALGALRLRHRTRELLVHLLGHLLEDELDLPSGARRRTPNGRLTGPLGDRLAPMRHIPSDDDQIDQHLALRGTRGRLRLLSGMVRDNRPWRLVPHLSSATAAAAATAAYGVFTTNFWSMANALAVWRLCLINALAIAAMSAWLLYYNRLWERPAGYQVREKAVLYNLSTLLTLLIGVACMYSILYLLALLVAGITIDSDYLQSQLHHPAGIGSYATIVWLTSSVGIVAGALGSSFESEDAVRKATYSRREQERQSRRDERTDDDQDDA